MAEHPKDIQEVLSKLPPEMHKHFIKFAEGFKKSSFCDQLTTMAMLAMTFVTKDSYIPEDVKSDIADKAITLMELVGKISTLELVLEHPVSQSTMVSSMVNLQKQADKARKELGNIIEGTREYVKSNT